MSADSEERVRRELQERIAAHKRTMRDRFVNGFDVCGGQLCFRGTRVLVECVVGAFAAGDDLKSLAEWYGLDEQAIHDAVRLVLRAKGVSLTSAVAERRIRRELERRG